MRLERQFEYLERAEAKLAIFVRPRGC